MARETFHKRLRRSVDWKAARPGFLLGACVSLLIALGYLRGSTDRVEFAALDYGFRFRSPNPPSPKLVLIGIDDNSIRSCGPPHRQIYAKMLKALDLLGARVVGFDITFDLQATDPFTGAMDLTHHDVRNSSALSKTFEGSGKAFAGFRCLVDTGWRARLDLVNRLKPAVLRKPDGSADEIGREAGLGPREVLSITDEFEGYRDFCLTLAVGDRLKENPAMTYKELRASFPNMSESVERTSEEQMLRGAYTSWKTFQRLVELRVPVKVIEFPPKTPAYLRPVAIQPGLLERIAGGGSVMTPVHDDDGVLRRAPLLIRVGNEPYFYLGVAMALKTLEDETTRIEAEVSADSVAFLLKDRASGAMKRTIRIPLREDGSTLANWVGRPGTWGHRGAPGEDYDQVPMAKLIQYYEVALEKYVRQVCGLAETLVTNDAGIEHHLPADVHELAEKRADWILAFTNPKFTTPQYLTLQKALLDQCAKLERDFPAHLETLRKVSYPPSLAKLMPAKLDEIEKMYRAMDFHGERKALEAQLKPKIEGRTALIGTTSTQMGDLHSTPMGVGQPGADLHMGGANLILTERVLHEAPKGWMVLLIFVSGLLVSLTVTYLPAVRSTLVTLALTGVMVAIYLGAFDRSGVILSASPLLSMGFSYAVCMFYRQFVTLKSQKQLQGELESKMSPAVVAQYLSNPDYFSKPRKVVATAFFSDIKGFTSISERMSAQELIAFINRYHDKMTQILIAHEAYIDKYIGDGIMALFGAPIEDERHALRACAAALKNVTATDQLNKEFKADELPEVKIRIGLNTGEMVAAKVGSTARADLTAMGDAVNLASRLEGANKRYGTSIMISDTTHDLVKGQFQVRELDTIRVMGKSNAVRVYELLGENGREIRFTAEFLSLYEKGLAAFKVRKWTEAEDHFSKAILLVPGEPTCQIYLDRLYIYRIKEPPRNWEPVYDLGAK